MDIIRLRTMTMKSKFNEGKYAGLTVEQVFNLGKFKLQHIYYNEPNITFTDEVLDTIGVWPEKRIEKPGKNPEMFEQIMRSVKSQINGGIPLFREIQIQRRIAKKRLAHVEARADISKGRLQELNHHGRKRG